MTHIESRTVLLGLLAVGLGMQPGRSAGQSSLPSVKTMPGGVVRWSEPGATRCGMRARVWAAVNETCYYPVDLLERAGFIPISIYLSERRRVGRIVVEAHDYGTEEVKLPRHSMQANPSAVDLRRDASDRALLSGIFSRSGGPAVFTLPLGAPLRPLPPAKSFGVKRVYNGKLAEQAHTGYDYDAPVGSPVLAVAEGKVVLAKEMFFEGNAVFIEHGDGLVSMYFHLADIKVQVGDQVKRGESLGREGIDGARHRAALMVRAPLARCTD